MRAGGVAVPWIRKPAVGKYGFQKSGQTGDQKSKAALWARDLVKGVKISQGDFFFCSNEVFVKLKVKYNVR